jgi:hypothetical protein
MRTSIHAETSANLTIAPAGDTVVRRTYKDGSGVAAQNLRWQG